MPTDANPLIDKDYRPVPWWSLAIFVLALPVIGFGVVQILPDRGMMTILGAFFVIGLMAVAVAVAPLGRSALPALGLRPAPWKFAVLGTLGTLVLSVAVSQFGIEPQGMKQVIDVLPGRLGASLVLLALLAPVVEELVFRGLLYGWVAGRWGSLAAWITSTLLFAIAHVEPAHVILVLPLGVLFGWLRRRTDSLVPSLVAHVVNNGFALIAAVYLPGL